MPQVGGLPRDGIHPGREFLLLLAGGGLLVLAFPPVDFFPAAFVGLVPLFYVLARTPARGFWSSFRPGFRAGLCFFSPLLYWLVFLSSIEVDNPVLMSGPLILLVMFQACYWGLFSAVFVYVRSSLKFPAVLVLPLLWVAAEQLRSLSVLGFPWGALGYAGVAVPRAMQFASLTGLPGVSFWMALVNAIVLELLIGPAAWSGRVWPVRRGRRRPGASSRGPTWGRLVTARWARGAVARPAGARGPTGLGRRGALAIALILLLGTPVLHGSSVLRRGVSARTIRVAVIQSNIEAKKKWDLEFKRMSFDVLRELSLAAAAEEPDLVVWPETAAPSYLFQEPVYMELVGEIARSVGAPILVGFPDSVEEETGRHRPSNSVLLMSSGGVPIDKYDKIHLVPFGEMIPFDSVLPFLSRVDFGEADFRAGRERVVFDVPQAKFSALVCFESIFPRLVRQFVQNGAELLVNVTNDVWYGRTSLPFQHASMPIMRCIENHRSLARCANSGVSLFVDPYGRVLRKTEIFERCYIVEDLPVETEMTFYARHGDVFASVVMTLSGLLVALSFIRRLRGRGLPGAATP